MKTLDLMVSDAPPQDKRSVYPVLEFLGSAQMEEESFKGAGMLTMPKGLTLDKLLMNIVPSSMTSKVYIDIRILEEFGNVAVNETYRLIFMKYVLKEGNSFFNQQQFVQSFGCKLTGILPAVAFAVMDYMNSPNSPLHFYVCCSEMIGNREIAVINLLPDTLFIDFYDPMNTYDSIGTLASFTLR